MAKGLPQQLEDEVRETLRKTMLKYINMKKKHMSRDRIVDTVDYAFRLAVTDIINQPLKKE
ncbi:MAG: hypothetical protein WDA09_05985 [Bacteriovoracaceae bacterium]